MTYTDILYEKKDGIYEHDYQHALQLSQSAVQQAPKNPRLWALQGIALSGLGRRHDALVVYNRALAISPDYLPALEGAAELEYQAESTRALPLLQRVVKLRPADPTANAMLGVVKYKQHDCVSATEHFRASWQLISSQPAALAQYGASDPQHLPQPESTPDVQRASAELAQASRAFDRASELSKRQLLSQQALDDAQQNGKQVVVQVSSPKDNATEVLKLCFVTTKTTNENKTDSLAS